MNSLSLLFITIITNFGIVCAFHAPIKYVKHNSFIVMQEKTLKSTSKAVAAALLLGGSISFPSSSFAAGFEASELFSKAESSIQATKSSYGTVESEWNIAKRLIDNNFKAAAKSSSSILSIKEDMSKLEQQLGKIEALGVSSLVDIQEEIDATIVTVNKKYESAAASATAPNAKPAAIAKLFDAAQNDAYILDQTVTLQKNLKDINNAAKSLHEKMQSALTDVTALTGVELSDVTSDQKDALVELNDGIDANLKFCRDAIDTCSTTASDGVAKFKKGAQSLTSSQEKFSKVLRSLDSSLRTTQSVKNDYERVLTKLESQKKSREGWEKKSGLSLKKSKQLANQYTGEVSKAVRDLNDKYKRFSDEYEFLTGKKVTGDKNKNDKSLVSQLRTVQEKLESAQRSGVAADKLLTKARSQGEKEAAKFLKNIPKPSIETSQPKSSSADSTSSKPYSSMAKTFKKDAAVMMSSP